MAKRNWLASKCFNCKKVVEKDEAIVIDEEKDLLFCSEDCLYQHFAVPIENLEKEYLALKSDKDISREDFQKYEELLGNLLEGPDEIWEDTETLPNINLHIYIGEFQVEEQTVYYVAVLRETDDNPSFVFLHFPTLELKLLEQYRRGKLIYSRSQSEIEVDASDEDALAEGDEMARGHFESMLKVRSKTDIPETEFPDYLSFRQETIEDSDEMWRHSDMEGNTFVHFLKEFEVEGGGVVTYVVVTIEDVVSGSHFILFSFPSRDAALVERYRQGEMLNAEAPPKQESH
jgi:hypothetical protein